MFWADEIVKTKKEKQVINDSWTPSGIIHMGSLKGPVIHDTLYKILKENGVDVTFRYGFDDMDPIDGLPKDLEESHSKYLGIPIFMAPSPDGKGSFGDFFGNKMKALLDALDIRPDILYRTSELYKNGTFNKAIHFVLDNASGVRKVYEDMYKKEISETWYPLQVICPHCGKLGTTKVTGWDGEKVTFSCEPNMVQWAKGCGATGTLDPFNGNSKMPWKVEWAAKWWTFGVTIEGAGKDHASAGGSYDVAMKLITDVFHARQPMRLGYEFFLSGGKKMSSSKGLGLTGEALLEVLAPQIARFLMIKAPPNQAVEFSPHNTLQIPQLYDDFEKAASSDKDYLARAYQFSKIGGKIGYPKIRFLTLAQLVQMPNAQDEIKKADAAEWVKYANLWIEKYAPESEKFLVQKELPEEAKELSQTQQKYLKNLIEALDETNDVEQLQTHIYELGKKLNMSSKDAFAAIYIALLGKNHGPKAAALIRSLDKNFVKKRFIEVSDVVNVDENINVKIQTRLHKPEVFSIDKKVIETFPSVSVGVATIRNVTIEKINENLEKEKEVVLSSLENLTTEQLGQYAEIISYRKLYKELGVDWHSRRPSPEALLRRIALKKGLYTVNTCVDAYNLVVLKHRVSVGAFDLDTLQMPTMLRFAKLGEEILLLGDTEPTKYTEKELAYFDANGGFNMDFNYRDAQKTAVQLTTKNLYINVDGIYDVTPEKVSQVLQETCDTIIKYCGGTLDIFGVESA
jgi:lysyl-tRNA synthetase class 1